MKTGNTRDAGAVTTRKIRASMEPGHEDREYFYAIWDEERGLWCLNGARS